MKKIVIAITFILSFSSCVKEETPSDLLEPNTSFYQEYWIDYEKDAKTFVSAALRENNSKGNYLKLVGPANIMANSNVLEYQRNDLVLYQYSTKTDSNQDIVLKLKKANGKSIENVIRLKDKLDVKFQTSNIILSKENGGTFTWEGNDEPYKTTEKPNLHLSSTNGDITFSARSVNSKTVQLTKNDLKNYNVGQTITLHLSRTRTLDLPHKDGSAQAVAHLYTYDEVRVKIVE